MIYIGTVSSSSGSVTGKGRGIYTLRENEDHPAEIIQVTDAENAGIITLSHDGTMIYAANESKAFGGINGSGGGVSAYRILPDGTVSFINDSISYGSRTAYTAETADGRYLLAVNHGSHTTVTCSYVKAEDGSWQLKRGFDDSSTALFALREDGGIGELKDLLVFRNNGYWCHGGGQSASHLHCIKIKDDLIFACNRGADEIEVMQIDRECERLVLLNQFHTRNGYAPRYLDFHPSLPIIYVLNENYPSLSVYTYGQDGSLQEKGLYRTMNPDYYTKRPLPDFPERHAEPGETNTCALRDHEAAAPSDIHVSDDHRFLYASNRYYDKGRIAVFAIHDDGCLKYSGEIILKGNDPRGFAVRNRILYAGLLDQNLVQVFRLNHETGLAEECLQEYEVPAPSSFILK